MLGRQLRALSGRDQVPAGADARDRLLERGAVLGRLHDACRRSHRHERDVVVGRDGLVEEALQQPLHGLGTAAGQVQLVDDDRDVPPAGSCLLRPRLAGGGRRRSARTRHGDEVREALALAVLEHVEVLAHEVAYGPALLVGHDHVQPDDLGLGRGRHLLRSYGRARAENEHCHDQGRLTPHLSHLASILSPRSRAPGRHRRHRPSAASESAAVARYCLGGGTRIRPLRERAAGAAGHAREGSGTQGVSRKRKGRVAASRPQPSRESETRESQIRCVRTSGERPTCIVLGSRAWLY